LRSEPLRRFKQYAAYKDSGVEWLGEVPAHWEVMRLKRMFRVVNGSTPASGEPAFWDGEIPWVTPEDLGALVGTTIESTRRNITETGYRSCGTTVVPSGSLVLSTRAPIGHLAVAGIDLCTNQGCRSLVFRNAASQRFFFYELLAARPELEALGQGSTFRELATQMLQDVEIATPPQPEQRAIAAFLDRETAQIDALVAKKERLIELLQEKRTALITRAVTKGLDPTVPTKDSGVEWLGEIPAHWETTPLKRAVHYVEGPGIMASDFMPEGVPLLRISGIGGRKATLDGCNYLSTETVEKKWNQFRVRSGDLLISGSASTGFCTEVDETTAGAIPYTGIIIVRPRSENVARDFVRWMLLSDLFTTQTDLARSGSTIQHFGPSHLARMRVVHPSLEEQQAIAAFLDHETARIDALVAKIHDAIDRLKELRTALISAAVTGEIDVREEVA
jgi:type I restriction enzyme S subunit